MEIRFPLILDGATGTELQKRGYDGSVCAEQWTLDHPEAILDVQTGYVEAGSQVLYTPTFGANPVKLKENGIDRDCAEMNYELAQLAKKAAGGKALVAGDISATGLFLYPLGLDRFEDFYLAYRKQAEGLEKAGVDYFVIETMMTVPEARAAVLAVRSVSDKPICVSFTCDENGKTLTGTDVTAAITIMQGMGVFAFGLNCSVGPDKMVEQLRRLTPYAQVPLVAKPNAGLPHSENGKTVYDSTPEDFAKYIPDMADAGVCMFGGCCGSDKNFVKAIADAVRKVDLKQPAYGFSDKLPCATEKLPFMLDADVELEFAIAADEDLEENLTEALAGDAAVVSIEISDAEGLEYFEDCQYMISKPLCIVCDDAVLLEKALRLYQGRAMYDGSLSDEALLPLAEKYGLII